MNWPVGRRASQPANTSFFRPGRFGGSSEMNQPQAPMSSPSAGVPMAVYDRPPEKRSTNAQLSSSTPIQSDAPMQPQVMGQPKAPADPLFAWAISQGRDPNDPQTKALFLRSQAPEQANPGDMTTPAPQRYGGPPGMKAPDFASQMQQKALSGQLSMADVLAARQMGEDGLAVAIMQALAGNGWNYTPRSRALPDQAAAPTGPYMGAYDRPGAGPGMDRGALMATMQQKAQAGQLTAADALIAEQAGDTQLASWIRNQVAGLGTPTTSRVAESQPGGGSRRYTTRIPGASKGIYTG